MAIVRGGIFDKEGMLDKPDLIPSGRVSSQIYFRYVNGKLQCCAMPSGYRKSMKKEQVDRRDMQRVNGKFCRFVNSNFYLHQVWEISDLKPKRIYNRISQANFHLCNTNYPSSTNLITPPGGFQLIIEKLAYDQGKVEAAIRPINLEEDELKIIYLLYMALYEPVDVKDFYFNFIPVKEGISENQDIIFSLDPKELKLSEEYNFKIFYICAITLGSNGEVMRYSQTVGADSGIK